MAVPDKPLTRLEQYWDGILEKIEGGGGATLVDKTVTANGEYDPADDNADGYSGVIVNVPNPNYVETIEGTLANPFGNYGFTGFVGLVSDGAITAILTFTYGSYSCEVQSMYNEPRFFVGHISGLGYHCVVYRSNGDFSSAKEIVEETSIGNENTPCTLTIIHHPLPSGT